MKEKFAQPKPGKIIAKKDVQKKGTFPQNLGPVIIDYPFVWLALAAFLVYCRTFWFGFTDLDDTIFIRDFRTYNEDLGNLAASFHRGLFDAVKDPYYRPVFLDSMILNYKLSGLNIMGYHIINVLLHMASVVLLYNVFTRIRIRKLHAFIAATLFAVHPVLSQAVAWIPGRNDTLLAVFAFSFFITAIDYSDFGKTKDLVLSILFLLLAYFTKETAVFVPVVAFIMLVFIIGDKLFTRQRMILYGSWVACFIVWYAVRSQASNVLAGNSHVVSSADFIHRLPLIFQYMGKIFFPVNQSVFPMQEDTTSLTGVLAIALLGVALFFSKEVNWRIVIAGAVVFILFLIPALLVPNNLNEQTFEHRLYLPIVGVLMMFTETALFKRVIDSYTLLFSLMIAVIFAMVNFAYQKNFSSPINFWTQAVETTPHSAYAKMMLAAREDNLANSYALFRESYRMDPKQKYINYYYGNMLQMQDSVQLSEQYLLNEKGISDYPDCDFLLSRVNMERGDVTGAINYMKAYLKRVPDNEIANNNLLRMYISSNKIVEARAQALHMRQMGLKLPPDVAGNPALAQ